MPRRVRKKQTKKSKPVLPAPPVDDDDQESGWYVIKDIIDERRVRGKAEYLVDWEDNPDTGKSYDPTWTKSRDVSKEARNEWQKKKTADKHNSAPAYQQQSNNRLVTNSDDSTRDVEHKTSQASQEGTRDSRSPDTTKSHLVRSRSPAADESELQPVRKKTKLNRIVSPPLETAALFSPSASLEPAEPIAKALPNLSVTNTLSVEIKTAPNFNPAEYLSTHGASQATAQPSQPRTEPGSPSPQLSYQTIPDSEDPTSLTASLPTADPVQGIVSSPQVVIPDSQGQTQDSFVGGLYNNETQPRYSVNSQKRSAGLSHENQGTTSSGTSRDIPSHQPNQPEPEGHQTQDSASESTRESQSGYSLDYLVSQRTEEPIRREEPKEAVENITEPTTFLSESQTPKPSRSLGPSIHQYPSELHLEEPSDRLSQAAQIPFNHFHTPLRSSSPGDNSTVTSPGDSACERADSAFGTPKSKYKACGEDIRSVEETRKVSPHQQQEAPDRTKDQTQGGSNNLIQQTVSRDYQEEESGPAQQTNSVGISPEFVEGESDSLIHQDLSLNSEVELESALQASCVGSNPKSLDEKASPPGADVEENSSEYQSSEQVDSAVSIAQLNKEEARPPLKALEPLLRVSQAFSEGTDTPEAQESSPTAPEPSLKRPEPILEKAESLKAQEPLIEPTKTTRETPVLSCGGTEPSEPNSIYLGTDQVQPGVSEPLLQVSEPSPKVEGRAPTSEKPESVIKEPPPIVEERLSVTEEQPLEPKELSLKTDLPRTKDAEPSLFSRHPSTGAPVELTDKQPPDAHQRKANCEDFESGSISEQGNPVIRTAERIEEDHENISPLNNTKGIQSSFDPSKGEFEQPVEPNCSELGNSALSIEDQSEKHSLDESLGFQETQGNQGDKTEQRPDIPHPEDQSLDNQNSPLESHKASARSQKSGPESIEQRDTQPNNVSEQSIPREPQSRRTCTLRQSASDIVQEILDSWGKGNNNSLSAEMFPPASTGSDPASHQVSAITELQNLWDSDDEVVAEPQQTESKAEAEAPFSLGLASGGISDEHGDLSNPAGSSDFLSQAPPWTAATTTELPHIGGELDSSTEMPQRSATDSMRDIINQAYGGPAEPIVMTLLPPATQDVEPVTVSPADISRPTEAEKIALPVLPLSGKEGFTSITGGSSGNSISMAQLPQTDTGPLSSSSSAVAQNDLQIHYVVTIPFQSSIRSLYDEILVQNRNEVVEFSSKFTQDTFSEPDKYQVQKIDALFSDLQNLCDYPQDIIGPSVKDMPLKEKVRYSLDANAKLSFVYELLLQTKTDTNVLIVARSLNILRMLCDLAEFSELECVCDALDYTPKNTFKNSTVRLTLVLSGSVIDPLEFDVVLGYDNAFQESPIAQALSWDNGGKLKPLVLKLATAYSIEHLSMEISDTDGNLVRRNALLYAIVQIRDTFRDPPRLMEPHKVAAIFSDYLNDDTQSILWEPAAIPAHAFDAFTNSQETGQMSLEGYLNQDNGRKHRLDDDEDPDTKRQRINSASGLSHVVFDMPPLSDQVKGLLDSVNFVAIAGVLVEDQLAISLKVMEKIAEKVAEANRVVEMNSREPNYKDAISRLEKQVKEFERTNDRFYESHRAALQDRTKFELDARKAEAALQASKEAAQANDEKHRQKIAQLEEAVARLMKESPAGENEKLIQEANAKVQVLEKRLETSHKNEDYVRQLYQDATTSTSVMRAENQTLKELSEDLKQKASENLKNIHEINNNNAAREYLRQISDLQIRLKDREMELDRAREELRQLKNGRRETRQVSVPRSPRMGMMSPRPGRTAFGSSSRAASPAPAFDNAAGVQPGNGRFSHLRE